jgi:hypothetical protein
MAANEASSSSSKPSHESPTNDEFPSLSAKPMLKAESLLFYLLEISEHNLNRVGPSSKNKSTSRQGWVTRASQQTQPLSFSTFALPLQHHFERKRQDKRLYNGTHLPPLATKTHYGFDGKVLILEGRTSSEGLTLNPLYSSKQNWSKKKGRRGTSSAKSPMKSEGGREDNVLRLEHRRFHRD